MARQCMILLLIAAVLGGCSAGGAREPAPPAPTPTLSPTTTLVSALPRQVGTDGGYRVFEVTAQQPGFSRLTARQILNRLLGNP
jgi:hypothetical protein